MTDIELIMQLARLEEIGEMNQLGENGVSSSNSKENLNKEESFLSDSSDTPLNILEEENKGSGKGVQEDLFSSKNLITPKKIVKDAHTEENDELKALADLEKELGLDELQLYLDSTSSTPAPSNLITPNTKNVDNKSSKSNFSMGVETGGSLGSFATPATAIKNNQIEEDDDNLDELERYLESLSTTK